MKITTLILGAGAAGMMAAAHAGSGVLIVDHAKAAGEKIRISGGARCNFTNLDVRSEAFISRNPHFMKSALKRYTQWDFIDLVARYGIAYHEKTLGQLFCDTSAKDIIAMLHSEMEKASAQLWLQTSIGKVSHDGNDFQVELIRDGKTRSVTARNLVVATGGKSIPKMGATGVAYQIADDFGLPTVDTRAGLVPLTFTNNRFKPLAGTALPVRAAGNGPNFDEAMLFTHRGLSGPAILQASSYWQEGETVQIDLSPNTPLLNLLRKARQDHGRKNIGAGLAMALPNKLAQFLTQELELTGNLADWSDARLQDLSTDLHNWTVKPTGSEGYRTAEVTLGGVDTDALDSKTMAAKSMPNLYFIGECVDVTGWLGGYNFQWAWSSGWAAGQAIRSRQAD